MMQTGIFKISIIILFMMLSACGSMLNGEITRTSDGLVLPMKIEISTGTGAMSAVNTQTGEIYKGHYTAVRGAKPYDPARTRAVLNGDQGGTLDVIMEILPGIRPTGTGTASDQYGNNYHVTF